MPLGLVRRVNRFLKKMSKNKNVDHKTVAGFGDEWGRFDQSELSKHEQKELFEKYFLIFPWHQVPSY